MDKQRILWALWDAARRLDLALDAVMGDDPTAYEIERAIEARLAPLPLPERAAARVRLEQLPTNYWRAVLALDAALSRAGIEAPPDYPELVSDAVDCVLLARERRR